MEICVSTAQNNIILKSDASSWHYVELTYSLIKVENK